VCLQDKESYGHRAVSLSQQFVRAAEEFIQRDEVSETLAHLGAVDGDHVVVHPVVNHIVTL